MSRMLSLINISKKNRLLSCFSLHIFFYIYPLLAFADITYINNLSDSKNSFIEKLTQEEKEWLAQAKETPITFTGDPNWLPYEAFMRNGEYKGIVADYLELVEYMTGLRFSKVIPEDWSAVLDMARSQSVQVISGDIADVVLGQKYKPITPYLNNKVSVLMRSNEARIQDLSDIHDRRIAYIKGYGYTSSLNTLYPSISFLTVENIQDGLESLNNGRIDALIVSSLLGTYSKTLYGYSEISFVGPTRVSMDVTLFVQRDETLLSNILNKALLSIEPHQKFNILSRWTGGEKQDENLSIKLTKKEREYLDSISPIRFTGDPNWLPYEAFDESDRYVGQVSEHLTLLSSVLGVDFDIVATDTWSESIQRTRDQDVDMISISNSSFLSEELLVSRSYTNSPIVIVTRHDRHYVDAMTDLRHDRVGVVRDYAVTELVKKKYPSIAFKELNSVKDALIAVSSNELDAVLVNSAQAIFNIEQLGFDNIKISGKTEFSIQLAFGIHEKYAPLLPILNRALDTIYLSPQQQEIFSRWHNVENVGAYDSELIYKIIAAFLVVFFLILLWARRLHKEVEKREALTESLFKAKEEAHQANKAKSKFLAVMSHELRTPLHGILGMLELLESSNLNVEQENAVRITKESSESLLNILNDILDFSKIEAGKLGIKLEKASIKNIVEKSVNAQTQSAYDKNVLLEMFINPVLSQYLLVDPVRIRQVFSNFLSNALKFTESGKVTVNVDVVEEQEEEITFIIQVKDTGIGISEENQRQLFQEFVQINMDSKRKFGGTGLGLSICRRLASLMGGEVELDSIVGQGTTICYRQSAERLDTDSQVPSKWYGYTCIIATHNTFVGHSLSCYLSYFGAHVMVADTLDADSISELIVSESAHILWLDSDLLLPSVILGSCRAIRLVQEKNLSANDSALAVGVINTNPLQASFVELLMDLYVGIASHEILTEKNDNDAAGNTSIKLLVAEDHPTNRQLISQQLNHIGVTFRIAEDGEQAVSYLQDESFDGLITDCHMPKMDGYELARYVRRHISTDMPIIAVTANALSGEKAKCLSAGMNDLLIKPLGIQPLSECIDNWFPNNIKLLDRQSKQGNTKQATSDITALETIFFGRENVLSMISFYWEATQRDIDDLKLAYEQSDIQLLGQIAHRIKGAAKIVFAEELVNISQTIEKLAKSGDVSDVEQLIGRLEYALGAHKKHIMNEL